MPFWTSRRPATAHVTTMEPATPAATAEHLRTAYEKGRRDARAERKRHPVIMTLLFVLAAVGASLITLAVVNGSFSGGGRAADESLATAAEHAVPAVQDAAARTGEAARDAGAELRDKSRDLVTDNKS